ncbi:histone acetyltransferase p300 [Trichonephila clavipes]|nr:histone acetyltransferase p300 [Trichonephila clavipes]
MLRLKLDSSLTNTWSLSVVVHFPRARHHSKRRQLRVGAMDSTRNGRCHPKCHSAWCLRMVREDSGASREVRSNSWVAQIAVPNDPRYARLETNLGMGHAKKG